MYFRWYTFGQRYLVTGMLVKVVHWRQCSVDSSSHQYNIHMDSVCSYYLVLSVCMLVYNISGQFSWHRCR